MSTAGFRKLAAELQDVAAKLDLMLQRASGEGIYFSLHVWPGPGDGAADGGHGSMLYVSNATREDVIRCMRDAIKKWEGGDDGSRLPPVLTH